MIRVKKRPKRVEELEVGDLVQTMKHGSQPIRWIGRSLKIGKGKLAPILIKKWALGNKRDLRVSPQHKMLITDWRARILYGADQVLVAAKDLVNDHDIIQEEVDYIEYFHVMFDRQEIIYAEGIPSESFYFGPMGEYAMDMAQLEEIKAIFGEFSQDGDPLRKTIAKRTLKPSEVGLLKPQAIR